MIEVSSASFRLKNWKGRTSSEDAKRFSELVHGHITHGMNFDLPDGPADQVKGREKDYSRLATTYYHRFRPAGVVMNKFDWFKDRGGFSSKQDSYHAAWMVGVSVARWYGVLPQAGLVGLWSEQKTFPADVRRRQHRSSG